MPHGIQLNWQETTLGCTYNVYRSLSQGQFDFTSPLASGLASSSYLDASGTPGTQYFYVTTAVLNGIESGPSNGTQATFPTVPVPPTNLSATVV